MQRKSLFIVIEGLDGSGKSTAGKMLTEELERTYPGRVKFTYEPENTSAGGEFIRAALRKEITELHPRQLALSYAANRLDHTSRIIKPWLETEGNIVICDRYYLSSLVYNSYPGFSMNRVFRLNETALKPDLIFFLNVSNEVCYARMKKRNEPPELFETGLENRRKKYFKAIRFLEKKNEDIIVGIDGNGTPDETVGQMKAELTGRFGI